MLAANRISTTISRPGMWDIAIMNRKTATIVILGWTLLVAVYQHQHNVQQIERDGNDPGKNGQFRSWEAGKEVN